jgi:hypothetical protein
MVGFAFCVPLRSTAGPGPSQLKINLGHPPQFKMTTLIRLNLRTNEKRVVIDLTGDDEVESDTQMITCDDLFPPALDGKTEYRVEHILDCWQPDEEVEEFQYLVKWFGYPVSEATWEWERDLTDCQEAIQDFHARN